MGGLKLYFLDELIRIWSVILYYSIYYYFPIPLNLIHLYLFFSFSFKPDWQAIEIRLPSFLGNTFNYE